MIPNNEPAHSDFALPVTQPQSIEDFFQDYWPALEARGWKSAILHSWKDLPERIDSDVDYVISGCGAAELLGFLDGYCRDRGWRLVQMIEHEPGAFFCSCMQLGGDYRILALDVTWNYRRLGHALLPGSLLLEGRRRVHGKSFHIPSPGAECAYILSKAAAKDKGFNLIRERLFELLFEDAENCVEVLNMALGFRGRAHCDEERLCLEVEEWFADAPAFRKIRKGRRLGLAEASLYLRRMLQPTGLWLSFHGASFSQLPAGAKLTSMRPLFRQTYEYDRVIPLQVPKALARVIRTSLVIEHSSGKSLSSSEWKMYLNTSHESSRDHSLIEKVMEHMAERVDQRIRRMRS